MQSSTQPNTVTGYIDGISKILNESFGQHHKRVQLLYDKEGAK